MSAILGTCIWAHTRIGVGEAVCCPDIQGSGTQIGGGVLCPKLVLTLRCFDTYSRLFFFVESSIICVRINDKITIQHQ